MSEEGHTARDRTPSIGERNSPPLLTNRLIGRQIFRVSPRDTRFQGKCVSAQEAGDHRGDENHRGRGLNRDLRCPALLRPPPVTWPLSSREPLLKSQGGPPFGSVAEYGGRPLGCPVKLSWSDRGGHPDTLASPYLCEYYHEAEKEGSSPFDFRRASGFLHFWIVADKDAVR